MKNGKTIWIILIILVASLAACGQRETTPDVPEVVPPLQSTVTMVVPSPVPTSMQVIPLVQTVVSEGSAEPVAVEKTKMPGEGASGGYMAPGTSEPISDWWGIIEGNKPGAQFDDCFVRQDMGQEILFGIDGMTPELQAQIASLRDSGNIVHLYGTLLSNVPDCNGSQIQVEKLVVEE